MKDLNHLILQKRFELTTLKSFKKYLLKIALILTKRFYNLYERFSCVNEGNISLILLFFGAIKCLIIPLLLSWLELKNSGKIAIAKGNIEIIKLWEHLNDHVEQQFNFIRMTYFYILIIKLENLMKIINQLHIKNRNFSIWNETW